MEKFYQLKQELLVMKTYNIKPNYSELARIHKCDRRTVKKYDNGYEGKPINRNKESKLDKYKEEIKDKLFLPGSTIKGTYQYFKDKDESIGNYSNFYKYTIRKKIKPKKANKFHPRYETEQVNNYNLIGRRTLKCTINMVKYSNLIYFLQH